jgi:DNA-binding PucR family transcriptional regulator
VGVLGGEDVEEAELSTLLNYEIGGPHLGLVVSTRPVDPGDDDAAVSATVAAGRIAKLLRPEGLSLTLPAGCDTAWLWVAAGPELGDARGASVAAAARSAGATVGIGEPGAGLAGFRETHLQAREAADCALPLRHSVARYADIALASTLYGDHARAVRLMNFALGGLVADGPKNERLRATLRAFLDSGLSLRATARELGTHHHTINYRLRQAEELLGHTVVEHAALIRSGLLIHELVEGADGTAAAPPPPKRAAPQPV